MFIETIAIVSGIISLASAITSLGSVWYTRQLVTSTHEDQEGIDITQEETDVTRKDGSSRHTSRTKYKLDSKTHAKSSLDSSKLQNATPNKTSEILAQSSTSLIQALTPGAKSPAASPVAQSNFENDTLVQSNNLRLTFDHPGTMDYSRLPASSNIITSDTPCTILHYHPTILPYHSPNGSPNISIYHSPNGSPNTSPNHSPNGSPNHSPVASNRNLFNLGDNNTDMNYNPQQVHKTPAKAKVSKFSGAKISDDQNVLKIPASDSPYHANSQELRLKPAGSTPKLSKSKSPKELIKDTTYSSSQEDPQDMLSPLLNSHRQISSQEESAQKPAAIGYKSKISPNTSPQGSKAGSKVKQFISDSLQERVITQVLNKCESAASEYATEVFTSSQDGSNPSGFLKLVNSAAELIGTVNTEEISA